MARICWGLILLFATSPLHADQLGADDRELLLERLKALKEAAEGRREGHIAIALAAFRPAAGSSDAAIELYLKCVEKLDFEDQNRKSQDFRDWKRRQKDKLKDPGMALALRLQLQWLVHTLVVAANPAEAANMAPKAADGLNDIFANAEKLSGQQNTLRRSVTSTVFARAYNVSDVDVGNWPTEPLALSLIYENVIFPPLRRPDKVETLRAAWLKRIQQEGLMAELWSGSNGNSRTSSREAAKPSAFEKFVTDERPNLIWRMEEDLFKAGDQRGAALRMLTHLEHYASHPSAPDWTDRFIGLITPGEITDPEDGTKPPDRPGAGLDPLSSG